MLQLTYAVLYAETYKKLIRHDREISFSVQNVFIK